MPNILDKVFQDLVSSNNKPTVCYFNHTDLPYFDKQDILSNKFCLDFWNSEKVVICKFIGITNLGIICYTDRESNKISISKYFNNFVLHVFMYNPINNNGITITTPYTHPINWANKKLYRYLKHNFSKSV